MGRKSSPNMPVRRTIWRVAGEGAAVLVPLECSSRELELVAWVFERHLTVRMFCPGMGVWGSVAICRRRVGTNIVLSSHTIESRSSFLLSSIMTGCGSWGASACRMLRIW